VLLHRFYDSDLAQASYLIGCQDCGEAVIVDANRDIEQYIQGAAAEHIKITAVTETHIHADFVSGARELAEATGAQLLLSAEGGPDWQYTYAADSNASLLRHGHRFEVGKVKFEVLHTPGHTQEHVSFLVTDTAAADRPIGMLTGDFLFVGDVGRPDLLERAAKVEGTMESMARTLFRSLRSLRGFPDYLQIWPGHGAGSACGKALGAVPSTTLGYERLVNWAFQVTEEDDFVRRVLEGQITPPKYFATMKAVNRDGPPPWPTRDSLPKLTPADVFKAIDAKKAVIDVRKTSTFVAQHIPGTINIPVGTSFARWAGSLLSCDDDIILIDPANTTGAIKRARHFLALIGYDCVVGYAASELMVEAKKEGRHLERTSQISAEHAAKADGPQIIDVRERHEWDAGHIARARHIFLGDLVKAIPELDRNRPIVVHCQGGTRSAIAASLLLANGFTNVSNLQGGMDAWIEKGLPVVREK
jgi:hydroxyacylglutathione hydrolase